MDIINTINDWLWTYLMIAVLLGAALYFTIYTGGVQFRMLPQMIKLLFTSSKAHEDPLYPKPKKKTISSFQAFTVSLASHVGTGNIAGVAIAIAVGGPGAVFWMWIVAIIGAANAFIESTLAQIFKVPDKNSFRGGPAYYIQKGTGQRWWAIIFAVLISLTFGLSYNSVQINTIAISLNDTFGLSPIWVGISTTVVALIIIYGGIQRISKVSEIVVPIMAVCYLLLALFIIITHISQFPSIIKLIIENAFGVGPIVGGGIGSAILLGVKRGLFSNEAGEGSTPNAAATADVTHPVKQGLIQSLGVYTDTLLICSATAFIILCSGAFQTSLTGVELTQYALQSEIGNVAKIFISIAVLMFAFTSIIGNYYYSETNLKFIYNSRALIWIFRIIMAALMIRASVATLDIIWTLADIAMGLMTLCNITAILILGRFSIKALRDFNKQRKQGKDPLFTWRVIPELKDEIESSWPDGVKNVEVQETI